MEWILEANCGNANTDLFFSKYKKEQDMAKSICQSCKVSLDCLKFAINNQCDDGIFGGLTAKERSIYASS
jgi:WhiB family transcriptional regulator, redox-sensing transcriptional regulator